MTLLSKSKYDTRAMPALLLAAAFSALPVAAACAQAGETGVDCYRVVPLPQSIVAVEGPPFVLDGSTTVLCATADSDTHDAALWLAHCMSEAMQMEITTTTVPSRSHAIRLAIAPESDIAAEGYRLRVCADSISIVASTADGLFHGVQTLRKAVATAAPWQGKKGSVALPAVSIADAPRLAYRAMHLDVSRHFFPISFIKRYIDMLSLHGINNFHWHLTDDQGWRIEIKKYPKLTAAGPHYTQAEIADVVDYARRRHVSVVPEIDLPGHVSAVLAAYPHLGCTGGPYQVATTYGVHKDVLCVGEPRALQFACDVMDEVMGLFTSEYIHAGGDECPRDRWRDCPKCQALIGRLGLTATDGRSAEDQLQGYFERRLARHIASRGRRMMGWDEIVDGGADTATVAMCWRGMDKAVDAARKGHDVIVTPAGITYLRSADPANRHALRRIFSFQPVPDTLSAGLQRHFVGMQGCMWTEHVESPEKAEHTLLPRLAAIADVAWSGGQQNDFDDFCSRLYGLTRLYDHEGCAYSRRALDVDADYQVDSLRHALTVTLSTLGPRAIRYTTDGNTPTAQSALYTAPITIDGDALLQARVVEPGDTSGVMSETIAANRATWKPARLTGKPHPSYTFGGAATLVDGIRGAVDYNSGRWLGFTSRVELCIDMLKPTRLSSVWIGTDVAISSAVMDVIGLEAWGSTDGTHYTRLAAADYPMLGPDDSDGLRTHTLHFQPATVRHLRIVATPPERLPQWHQWPGSTAFVFIDEVGAE